MANTEYQIMIEVEESKDGVPIFKGKQYHSIIWIQATTDDDPYDVIATAKNHIIGHKWKEKSTNNA